MSKRKRQESPQLNWHGAPYLPWQKWIAHPPTARILLAIDFTKSNFKLTELPPGDSIIVADVRKETETSRSKRAKPREKAKKQLKPPPSKPKETLNEQPNPPPPKRTRTREIKKPIPTPASEEDAAEYSEPSSSEEEVGEDSDSSYSEAEVRKKPKAPASKSSAPKRAPAPAPIQARIPESPEMYRYTMSNADWAERDFEDQMENDFPDAFISIDDALEELVSDDGPEDKDEDEEERRDRQMLKFEQKYRPELVADDQMVMQDIMDDLW